MTEPYPLKLRAVPQAKVWGGRNLEKLLGKELEPAALIGETWEAHDSCRIENGAYAGSTLNELIERDAKSILGANARDGHFPLLFKFIDAQADLSVQVHPSDEQAQAIEDYPFGKSEAWYIIHAEPNAALIHGFKEDVTLEHVKAMLAAKKFQEALRYIPVNSGDVVFVPAGTIHAITRGIALAEIQENSDITYRLFDWGRVGKGRDLHVEQSLRVANLRRVHDPKIPRLTIHRDEYDQHFLVVCKYFSYELFDIRSSTKLHFDKFNIISFIAGTAEISFGSGLKNSVRARLGETFVLPASLRQADIAPSETPCRMLRAYVPDLHADVITPLAQAGFHTSKIEQLGGTEIAQNDLKNLL